MSLNNILYALKAKLLTGHIMLGRCFASFSDCFYGTGEWTPAKAVPVVPVQPEVLLDSANMGRTSKTWSIRYLLREFTCPGPEAVIVKNGSRLCGTGSSRATAPIQQNKAYWEVKVQQDGIWSCGVCHHLKVCLCVRNLSHNFPFSWLTHHAS